MFSRLRGGPLLCAALAFSFSGWALGQPQTSQPESPTYGTASQILYHVGFSDFVPGTSAATNFVSTELDFKGLYSDQPVYYFAVPHLPAGALLTSYRYDFCDTDVVYHGMTYLFNCNLQGGDCEILSQLSPPPGTGTGCSSLAQDLTSRAYTVDNSSRELIVVGNVSSGTRSNVLVGAFLGYRLQVSSAPSVATFSDVPTTSPQFKFVEALVAAGVTAGCGPGIFCPTQPVTRGQMAVFLAVALGLHFPN